MLQLQSNSAVTYSFLKPCRVIDKLKKYLEANFCEPIDLDDLASAASTDRFRLCRRFRQRYGLTPVRWLWRTRVYMATQLIELNPDWSLTDIAFSCGFSSSAHFSRSFKQEIGSSPSHYRDFYARQLQHSGVIKKYTGSLAEYFAASEPLITKAMRRALISQAISKTSA